MSKIAIEQEDDPGSPEIILVHRCVDCGAVVARRRLAVGMTDAEVAAGALMDGAAALRHVCQPKRGLH